MKFYYLNWDDYSFHEVEGEYVEKINPRKHIQCKYAKLEGIERPVVIDYHVFSVGSRNYSSSLEELKGKTIEWVKNWRLYLEKGLEQTRETVNEIEANLADFNDRTSHLFEGQDT